MVTFGFLIRLLDQELYGLLLVAGGLIWQFNFLQFGLAQSLERFIPKFFLEDRGDDVPAAIGFTIVVFLAVGIVLGGAFATFALLNGGALFSQDHAGLANRLFLLCAGFSPFLWPLQALSSVLVGYGRIKLDSVLMLLTAASRAALLVGGALSGWSIEILLIATMVNILIFGFVRGAIVTRLVGKIGKMFGRRAYRIGREIFGYSGWLFLNNFAQAITSRFDQFIVGAFLGAEAVPIYWALMRVIRSIPMVGSIFKRPVVPIAAELFTKGGDEGLHALATQGTRIYAAFLTPFIVMIALFAEPLLAYWGGQKLVNHTWVVQLSALLLVPVVIRGMLLQAGLAKYAVARVSSLFAIGVAGLHVAGLVGAIAFLGLSAAVLSWALVHFLVSPWWVHATLVRLQLEPISYYASAFVGAFPSLCVGTVILVLMAPSGMTQEPLLALESMAGTAVLLVAASLAFGIGREPRAFVVTQIVELTQRFRSA